MKEILLLDKPKGKTSFWLVSQVRHKYGVKKVGHAGTLDPLATGLMVLGVGEGTKKLTEFLKLSKVYDAEILLGIKTDTGDLEGKVLEEKAVGSMQDAEIQAALTGMVGNLHLPVPIYSAIKQNGKRLYELARKGKKLQPPTRTMQITKAEYRGMKKNEEGKVLVQVTFSVGSGTYIRSLAEELGRRLGLPATLANLRRTRIGDFKIEDSQLLETI